VKGRWSNCQDGIWREAQVTSVTTDEPSRVSQTNRCHHARTFPSPLHGHSPSQALLPPVQNTYKVAAQSYHLSCQRPSTPCPAPSPSSQPRTFPRGDPTQNSRVPGYEPKREDLLSVCRSSRAQAGKDVSCFVLRSESGLLVYALL
jgi:hypothetical protein